MLSDPPRKPNERRTKALLGLALLIAAGLTFVANGRQMLDDAYIHLRYAWQLLHEHRLEYNPGQPSAGSSAVGYTLLLAALGAPLPRDWWPAMVQASSVVCWVVCWITAGTLMARLLPVPTTSRAACNWRLTWTTLAVGLLFLPPATARWFHDGMETSMVIACAFGVVVVIERVAARNRRSFWSAVALGALIAAPFLVRIDGVLISGGAAALACYRLSGTRRRVALAVAFALAVVNVGVLFQVYAGQFPDSMAAKAGIGGSRWAWLGGFCKAMVTVSPLWFLFSAFPLFPRRGRRFLLEVAIVFGPLAAVFAAGLLRKQAIHGARYFLPMMAWSLASAAHLLAHRAFVIRLELQRHRRFLLGAGVLAALHTLALLPRTLTAKGSYDLPPEASGEDKRLMLFDVGIIGWDSRAIILDLSGLINGREVAKVELTERPCVLTKQLGAPDYLILRPDQAAKFDLREETVFFSCDGVSLTHAYRRTGHVVMNSNQYQRQSALTMYLWAPVSVPVR